MRILFVNAATPAYRVYYAKASALPNGVLYMASLLEQHGHEVRVFDQFVDERKAEDYIDFAPDIIGFTVIAGPNLEGSIAQTKLFRKLFPGVPIVWGNVHPSVLTEQCLREDYIDYVVVGAGEFTFLELTKHLTTGAPALGEIQGLAYKKDGRPIINGCRPFVQNLEGMPDPAWHLIDVKKYSDIGLNTSRGCAHDCGFCYNRSYNKGYYAYMSAERIMQQIEFLRKNYNAKHIRFNEDNFTFNRKRLREFCQMLIDRKIKIKWSCDSRADLSEADIALMKKSGCDAVGLGIESGSQRMLDFMNKAITVEQMEGSFWLLVKYKIRTSCYILYGLPTETVDDFNETQAFLKRLDNPYYMFNRFVPFPGSALFEYCISHKLIDPPEKLEDWPKYLMVYSSKVNLTDCPEALINEAATNFRNSYAIQRFRFTLKHDPGYFKIILTNPAQFLRELGDLVTYHLQIRTFNKKIRKRVNDPAAGGKDIMARLVHDTVKNIPDPGTREELH